MSGRGDHAELMDKANILKYMYLFLCSFNSVPPVRLPQSYFKSSTAHGIFTFQSFICQKHKKQRCKPTNYFKKFQHVCILKLTYRCCVQYVTLFNNRSHSCDDHNYCNYTVLASMRKLMRLRIKLQKLHYLHYILV